MRTHGTDDSAASALLSKSGRAVLSLLFGHAGEVFYLRQIARLSGLAVGSIQRELKRLTEAGIITRSVQGRQVYFRANEACPVFGELKSILIKTAGVADVLRAALAPLADRIRVAFMFGSMTTGREKRDSDVDVMVVGDASFADVVKALGVAQNTLHREINPTVYPPDEFVSKLSAGHHFLKSLVGEKRIFLIGDENDFARLVKKRLAR
jgi:DNA-binding transcriptional ArsR family regulator